MSDYLFGRDNHSLLKLINYIVENYSESNDLVDELTNIACCEERMVLNLIIY